MRRNVIAPYEILSIPQEFTQKLRRRKRRELRLYAPAEQTCFTEPTDSSSMSIFIITGARSLDNTAHGIPKEVVSQLVGRAAQAGKNIAVRGCQSAPEMAICLRSARDDGAEFILLDPGPRDLVNGALAPALKDLLIPYIEVHDDHSDARETPLDIGHPLNVIQGYGAQSYVMALSIALEHMGFAECENDIHVGT
jgi:3-dehydroquinate dehydratase-1